MIAGRLLFWGRGGATGAHRRSSFVRLIGPASDFKRVFTDVKIVLTILAGEWAISGCRMAADRHPFFFQVADVSCRKSHSAG